MAVQFLYPGRFVVHQPDNDLNHWVPALFTHRGPPYFLVGDTLGDLVQVVQDGVATGDSDPIEYLRVVEIESGDLYRLSDDRTGLIQVQEESAEGIDKRWFSFV